MDEKTFKEIKTNFQSRYFKYIKPNLDKFEEKRIKKLKTYNTLVLPICIAISICLLILFLEFAKQGKQIDLESIGIVAIPLIICKIVFYAFEKNLENEIKKTFMPTICKCFDGLNWTNNDYRNPREFHEIGLVNYYNDESFDDIFYGNYKDVNFEIIESKLVHETRGSKNRSRHTIFFGIILKLTMPKDFESHTLIRPDGLLKMPIKNLKRTELEDVIFEKKYDVYTNNEVEARVTITTGFMERLNNIEKVFNSQKTYCCFIDNKAYFGLHTKRDMFKICSLKQPINNPKYFAKMFEEMISIYRLIDYLKLAKEVNT